jgi:hypothetical protein
LLSVIHTQHDLRGHRPVLVILNEERRKKQKKKKRRMKKAIEDDGKLERQRKSKQGKVIQTNQIKEG